MNNTGSKNSSETLNKGVDVLKSHIFQAGEDKVYMKQTPYGQYRSSLAEISQSLLSESDHLNDDPIDDQDTLYGLYLKESLLESEHGNHEKMLRQTQRAFADGYEEVERVEYGNGLITPIQGKSIFLQMGKEQFGDISIEEINLNLPKLLDDTYPAGSFDLFNNSMKKEEFLSKLEIYIHHYKHSSSNPLAPTTSGDDMKALYMMILLEDHLKKIIYGNSEITMNDRKKIDNVRSTIN